MFHFAEIFPAEKFTGLGYAVVRKDGMFALIATREIAAGEFLFRVVGKRFARPTFTSVQTGRDVHIDVDPKYDIVGQMDRYPWRFTNHHCSPTARMIDAECVAIRTIRSGKEITFNYNTTELRMDEPFRCRCGSAQCFGLVGGYQLATEEQKALLKPHAAEYLLD